jgi:predicted metal-dependent RNase
MELIIHRGAHEVGGSCLQVMSGNSNIIIDAGLPLSFMEGDRKENYLPQPLFNDLLSGKIRPDAFFCHTPIRIIMDWRHSFHRISRYAAAKLPKS